MSLEYPCVYYKPGGLCEKYSTDGITSYCVQGPCPDQRLSNSDRIRAMTDEELAEHIWKKAGCPAGRNYVTCGYAGSCKDCWVDWLQQPAEEDT